MKIKLYQILICLIFCTASSQSRKSLETYYKSINAAEISIVNNDLKSAKKNYVKAFKTGFGFPIDKYNALRLSYNMKDTVRSVAYFNDLARLGQDKKRFIKYFLHTSDSTITDSYLTYITKDYEKIHEAAVKSTMPFHAKLLDSIFKMDQHCRNIDMSKEEYAACNRNVLDALYTYVDKYGFPDQNSVGLFEDYVGQGPNPGTFDLLLWHSRGDLSEKIYEIGFASVAAGKYDSGKFARGFVFDTSKYVVLIPEAPLSREELKSINKKRAEIFLESLEDYSLKIEFMKKSKMSKMDYFFVDPFFYGFAMSPPLKIKE